MPLAKPPLRWSNAAGKRHACRPVGMALYLSLPFPLAGALGAALLDRFVDLRCWRPIAPSWQPALLDRKRVTDASPDRPVGARFVARPGISFSIVQRKVVTGVTAATSTSLLTASLAFEARNNTMTEPCDSHPPGSCQQTSR